MQATDVMTKDIIHNKSVLVVDDDERMLRALDKVLTSEGANVMCSSWAGSAIGLLRDKRIPVDLVIVDLSLPFISGLTTVHAIHNHHPSLPIIVLTGYGSPAVKAECLREGAAAFLEKPLDSRVLIEAIKDVFELEGNRTNKDGRMAKGRGEIERDHGNRN